MLGALIGQIFHARFENASIGLGFILADGKELDIDVVPFRRVLGFMKFGKAIGDISPDEFLPQLGITATDMRRVLFDITLQWSVRGSPVDVGAVDRPAARDSLLGVESIEPSHRASHRRLSKLFQVNLEKQLAELLTSYVFDTSSLGKLMERGR